MSTTNTTTRARISCDTRWQPQNKPIDHRYVSGIRTDESKFGLQFLSTEDTTEIKQGFHSNEGMNINNENINNIFKKQLLRSCGSSGKSKLFCFNFSFINTDSRTFRKYAARSQKTGKIKNS